MPIFIQATLALTVVSASALGVLILVHCRLTNPRILLAIHFFSISVWALSILFILRHESPTAIEWAFASAVVLAISKYYFIISFPYPSKQSGLWRYLPALLAIPIFTLAFIDNTYFTSFSAVDGTYILTQNGDFSVLYMMFVSAILVYPIINLYQKMRSGQYNHPFEDQIKFLFLGVSLSFILGLTTNSILPVVFGVHHLNGIGPSISLVLAGFILYIINKYHFLGLSLIVQRGLIYSTLFTGIVAVYLSILFASESLFRQPLINPMISGLLTCILGIFSVPHIDSYLRKKTDKFFFKDGYDYSDTLQHTSEILDSSLEITLIKDHIIEILEKTLKAGAVHIHLYPRTNMRETTKEDYGLADSDGIVFPLSSNNKLIGRLVLHGKRSGEPYTPLDMKLLRTLSYHLGMAFERALLYKELQDYSRLLEEKVTARTAELNNSYNNQRMMISNIAHGLQTPLTIIEGEMEMLINNHQLPDYLLPLRRSLSSISDYITSLLRLARLESEGESLDFGRHDLGLLIDEIVSYVALLATDKGVLLESQIAKDVQAQVDPKKFEEMLLALINNSFKYRHPAKKPKIIIRLDVREQDARISVSDNGIGIPKESLGKIFNRFYRVPNEYTENVQGSGLGLSIAKTIIVKHRGNISVESIEGIGTTFTITLPIQIEIQKVKQTILLD